MSKLSQFTNLYSLSKTLRFELKPIGKTLDNINEKGLIAKDEHRKDSYKKVKKIIDSYHKMFIDSVLRDFRLPLEKEDKKCSLNDFFEYYTLTTKTEEQKQRFKEIQADLRKQIAEALTSDNRFKTIDKKELIKQDLQNFVDNNEDKELVEEFKDFVTYFDGFHKNRKNMYSDEAKSTAIAYRLVHENLPKFIDNMRVFQRIEESQISENFKPLYNLFAKQGYMNVNSISEMFALNYYNVVLTQSQIELYNTIIGGKTENDGTQIKGLNNYIKEYNDQHSRDERLPKFKTLFKQILSDREQISWRYEDFKTDNEVLSAINEFYKTLSDDVLDRIKTLIQSISDYDLNRIYLKNDKQLTNISQKMFGDWGTIKRALLRRYEQDHPQGRMSDESYNKRKSTYLKSLGSVSIEYVDSCLESLDLDNPVEYKIEDFFSTLDAVNTEDEQTINIVNKIRNNYSKVQDLLTTEYPKNSKLNQDKNNVEKLKDLLDSIKSLQLFLKPLLGNGDEAEKDERFYGEFVYVWNSLDDITLLYNKVRNYVTQKPYSIEKFKLNFENSSFLTEFSQEFKTKGGVIIEKDDLYYLAIIDKFFNENEIEQLTSENGDATRIILDYQKPDFKNVPRLFIRSKGDSYAPAVKKYGLPVEEIIKLYDYGWFKTTYQKKNPQLYYRSLHRLIDYFKLGFSKHESYSNFDFVWKDTTEYDDINDFYHDVTISCYRVIKQTIKWNKLLDFVEDGRLYLFQIYNKDFSSFSKGTPNMHTLYWKMLFNEENMKQTVYQLNTQGAEVFYRKSSIDEKKATKHPENQSITNKNKLNGKKQSIFKYELTKDKRYTVGKFQFHVPISLNFKGQGLKDINPLVNQLIRTSNDLHIIGIDRGERNLLYVSVIDLHGNVVDGKQFSLNTITNKYKGENHTTDYRSLLKTREDENQAARSSWQTIENIKELKQGYLSQVVHQISQLVVKYNAIVVLEDLSMGFKQSRQKVESSVYQQFEKALIDKLNYLVDKHLPANEEGGLLHAYQLANSFTSFKDMNKQNGFLFYVRAWNTSKIDPVTGFVNLFNTRYDNVNAAKIFFSQFDLIRYNATKNWFEFKVSDYSRFNSIAEDTRLDWLICTKGIRIKTFQNPQNNSQWDNEEINLTDEFKAHFEKFGIDITGNLKEAISEQSSSAFFKGLLSLFKLTVQMRNSITNSEVDYLVSPVADENGNFYDSRTCPDALPKDADANGAYHIALKGLMAVGRIRKSSDEEVDIYIKDKDWLKFAQQKPYKKD